MNKHQAHHYYKHLRQLRWQYLSAAAGVSGVVSVLALRSNNEYMATLRQAVFTADKNNENVQTALGKLQVYVTSHMNTNLDAGDGAVYPPIQLQYTYQRLEQAAAAGQLTANNGLYTAAESYCEKQNPTGFSGRYRIDCITQYVQQHGSTTTLSQTIPKSLYQFDFVSPRWSPDLAGISLLLVGILIVAAIAKFIADRKLN